jgi:hypothetical protein
MERVNDEDMIEFQVGVYVDKCGKSSWLGYSDLIIRFPIDLSTDPLVLALYVFIPYISSYMVVKSGPWILR